MGGFQRDRYVYLLLKPGSFSTHSSEKTTEEEDASPWDRFKKNPFVGFDI